jgi:predicted Kef-type K+ transport protein
VRLRLKFVRRQLPVPPPHNLIVKRHQQPLHRIFLMKIIPSSEDVLALFITSSTFHHLFTTFFLMAASFAFIMSFFFKLVGLSLDSFPSSSTTTQDNRSAIC